jgi:hypothetical protein
MLKWLRNRLGSVLDRYEARALEVSEFTALLALKSESNLSRETLLAQLRLLDQAEPSPFAFVPGLHQARFIVLERAKLAANEAAEDFEFGPLIFHCVHDGAAEDVLHGLFEHCGEALDGVLAHCDAYPGLRERDACVQQLMAAHVPSSFFFRGCAAPRAEVQRALQLRKQFVEFVTHQQRANDPELWRAFDHFRAGRWPERPARPKSPATARARARASARPAPAIPANDTLGHRLDYGLPLLRPFERASADEQYWVRRLTELSRVRSMRKLRRGSAVPDSKPAKHALLRATFSVRPDIPAELQHGVFIPGSRYAAWLRVPNEDESGDPSGVSSLGIKLERVGALGDLIDAGLPDSSAAACQDFVLSSHRTFFAKDLRDYTVLRSILDTRDARARARGMSVFALRRPREALIAARRWLHGSDRPLERDYHSMTAFALGPQLAVKYCLQPLTAADASRPLGETLAQRLDPAHGESLSLEFCAIVPSRDVLPVEDPRIDWETAGANRIVIARIDVERQDLRSPERLQLADSLTFTPWHTLEAHRPLGGFNRARLEIDRANARAHAAHSGSGIDQSSAHERTRLPSAPPGAHARRTNPPNVRASLDRRSSVPHVRSRSSAPPADRMHLPKSFRAPARRKRNRSVH